VGNVDGDALADVVVGATDAANNGRFGSGSSYVSFGSAATSTPAPTPTPTPTPAPTPRPTPTTVVKPPAAEVIPQPDQAIKLASAKKYISRDVVRIKFVRPPGSPVVKRIQVFLNGKSVKVVQGYAPSATVNLKKLPTKPFTIKATLTYASGKKLTAVRKYKPCSKKKTKPK